MEAQTCPRSINFLRSAFVLLILVPNAWAQSVSFTSYDLPGGEPLLNLTTGPDGALWVASYGGRMYRISQAGVIARYAPAELAPLNLVAVISGPDGALWFAASGGEVGRMTTDGSVDVFKVAIKQPMYRDTVSSITAGPDGALWVTETTGKIARITTAGAVSEFPIPTASSFPNGITAGPDGALWFTEKFGNRIGRITTAGTITAEYLIPTVHASPEGIVAGPDGALWFTEGQKIGRITTAGGITEYDLGGPPNGITAGPDGALWATDTYARRLWRISTSGYVTEYSMPPVDEFAPNAYGVAVGGDGALWFTTNTHVMRAVLDTVAGSLAQVVSGGGWKTTFFLSNSGNTMASVQMMLYGDDGNPLPLPFASPLQPGVTNTFSALGFNLPPHFMLVLETEYPAGEPTRQGWAWVNATATVSSFAVFSFNGKSGPQEATVPLEVRNGSFVLPFDSLNFATGVAVANLSPLPAVIPVTIWDELGNLRGSDTIKMAAHGHTAFTLSDATYSNVIALAVSGRRGSISFGRPLGGQISVVGLRFSPAGTFTTIPTGLK